MKESLITCTNSLGQTAEFDITDLQFRPSIYGVIVQDGKVLLSPQWDGYDFPGGGMDIGESLFDALKREVKEETGYDVEPDKLLHVADDLFLHPINKKGFHAVTIYYSCRIVGGQLSTEGFDQDEQEYARLAEWVDTERIDTLKYHNIVDSPALIRKSLG